MGGYFLFHIIIMTPASTTATAPMIMQRSVFGEGEGFFGGGVVEGTEENVTDCGTFFPFTVMEPEDFTD